MLGLQSTQALRSSRFMLTCITITNRADPASFFPHSGAITFERLTRSFNMTLDETGPQAPSNGHA
jgi:hypothetical protein